jgi:hypothetical protein
LKEIGHSAFQESAIKSIRIPRRVEKIGAQCFCRSKNLVEVIFESGSEVKEIGEFAFVSCGLGQFA